jgi:hypothetical protein
MEELLRDYQLDAIERAVEFIAAARGRFPMALITAPTGAGKSWIMRGIARRAHARLGLHTIVLTNTIVIAEQLRAKYGMHATTVQGLLAAAERRPPKSRPGSPAFVAHMSSKLGLPAELFDKPILVLVDEAHWAFSQARATFDRAFETLPGARGALGFTATVPRLQPFPVIRAARMADEMLAPAFGSVIHTATFATLPYQLALWPTPGVVFMRSIAAGAIVTLASEILRPGSAAMSVASLQQSLRTLVDNAFKPEAALKGDESEDVPSHGPMERVRRRRALLARILALGEIRSGPDARARFRDYLSSGAFGSSDAGVEKQELIETAYLGDLAAPWQAASENGSPEAVERLREALLAMDVPSIVVTESVPENAPEWIVSVSKLAEGWDYPKLRTVCIGEAISASHTAYIQRAGRGARVTPDKKAFDLIDARYLDPDAEVASRVGISWRLATGLSRYECAVMRHPIGIVRAVRT